MEKGFLSLINKKIHLDCGGPVNVDLKLPIFMLKMPLFHLHFLSSFCIHGRLLTVGPFFIWFVIFICELIFSRTYFSCGNSMLTEMIKCLVIMILHLFWSIWTDKAFSNLCMLPKLYDQFVHCINGFILLWLYTYAWLWFGFQFVSKVFSGIPRIYFEPGFLIALLHMDCWGYFHTLKAISGFLICGWISGLYSLIRILADILKPYLLFNKTYVFSPRL